MVGEASARLTRDFALLNGEIDAAIAHDKLPAQSCICRDSQTLVVAVALSQWSAM